MREEVLFCIWGEWSNEEDDDKIDKSVEPARKSDVKLCYRMF